MSGRGRSVRPPRPSDVDDEAYRAATQEARDKKKRAERYVEDSAEAKLRLSRSDPPAQDGGQLRIEVEMPQGTDLDTTAATLQEIEQRTAPYALSLRFSSDPQFVMVKKRQRDELIRTLLTIF